MMDRRAFVGAMASGLLALPFAAKAQQAGTMYTIGYLTMGTKSDALGPAGALRPLKEVLRDLGYVEGRNLTVEARFADGRVGDLPVTCLGFSDRS